jgi:SHS2 domain-containing protein
LAEAIRALAATYAEPRGDTREAVPFAIRGATDADLLVAVLDETVYLTDARGLVAVDATVTASADGVEGIFAVVTVDDVEAVGPAPKAVARSDLVAGPDSGGWRGRVTVDV